jgi:hypothetical protein
MLALTHLHVQIVTLISALIPPQLHLTHPMSYNPSFHSHHLTRPP